MYTSKIQEFADAFFKHVNNDQQNKEKSEKDTSTETKKRRRSTDQDENEEENMEPSGERSVKPKVTMECHTPENLDEFIKEFKKEIYLEIEEELVETKRLHPLHGEVQQGSKGSSSQIDTSIQMSTSRKKSSISTIEENVQPWKSSGRHSQYQDT